MTKIDFKKHLNKFRKDPKIGLALSSGSARGVAHIGVVKAIMERDIPIDMVAGASAGAIVSAYFAAHGHVDGLEQAVREAKPKVLMDMMSLDLAVTFKGFIGQKKSLKWLKSLLGGLMFSDLKIPLAIMTTDMHTGEEVVVTKGSVLEAVRASISMPVLFTPIKSQGRYLVDGCFANPMPVDTLKNMGANFVIASNVIWTPEIAQAELNRKDEIPHIVLSEELEKAKTDFFKNIMRVPRTALMGGEKSMPNMFNVLINSIYTSQFTLVKSKMRQADLTISPDIRDLSVLDFFGGTGPIVKGHEAASKKLSRLITTLTQRKRHEKRT
jgi:NTE family protein